MSKNSLNIGQMQAYYDKRSRSVKLTVKEPGSPLKEQGFLITLPEGSTGYRMILDELIARNAAHDVEKNSVTKKSSQPPYIQFSKKHYSSDATKIPIGHTIGDHETQHWDISKTPHALISAPHLYLAQHTMHVMLHHAAQHQGDVTVYYYQGSKPNAALREKLETLDTPFENISLHDDTSKFNVVKALHTALMHRYAYLEKQQLNHITKTARHFPRLVLMIEDYEQWAGNMSAVQELFEPYSLPDLIDSVMGLREYDESSTMYKSLMQDVLRILFPMMQELKNQRTSLHREDLQQQFLPMIPWEKSDVHILKSIVEDADTWKACVDACRGTGMEAKVMNLYHKILNKTQEAHTFQEIAGLLQQYIRDVLDTEMQRNQEYLDMLHNLLRLGRAAGVHVVIATEERNKNLLPGEPRKNMGFRAHYPQKDNSTIRIQDYNELPVDCTPFRWSI